MKASHFTVTVYLPKQPQYNHFSRVKRELQDEDSRQWRKKTSKTRDWRHKQRETAKFLKRISVISGEDG